jgi:cysteinyl-tRNA synthetase
MAALHVIESAFVKSAAEVVAVRYYGGGRGRAGGATTAALGVLVERLVAERNRARSDQDWATADRIRDDIDAAGITLEDGADTTRWSING